MENGTKTTGLISSDVDRKGVHHFYLGIDFMVVSFLGLLWEWFPPWVCLLLFMAGVLLCVDDFIQHWKQRSDPSYRSLVNRLYVATLWHIEPIRWLNILIDKLLGKK